VGSISHKRNMAVGMVARDGLGTLGVDLEDYAPARLRIIEHVLTEAECAELAPLPEDRRWIALLMRFSIKESIYKALDPYVGRYVGFHEAEVRPDLHGDAEVTLNLKNDEGPFEVRARYEWLWGRLLTSVRIRPTCRRTSIPTAGRTPVDPARQASPDDPAATPTETDS
jgi:phosphopantetheine--protein transferase-like protein